MNLLLQLHGDLPERFPGHERRLYLWACKRKACRRKEGSVRGFRAVKINQTHVNAAESPAVDSIDDENIKRNATKPTVNLGETLFGVQSPSGAQNNPFSTSAASTGTANPFASSSSPAAKEIQKPVSIEPLAETFAQKARISSPPPPKSTIPTPEPQEPWPERSAFPKPYQSSHVDADVEYLDTEPQDIPSNASLERGGAEGESSSNVLDDKAAFESSMDKTFQRFADRLSQNPEQILRYEYDGQPLLYSKKDSVGKMLAPALDDSGKVQVAKRANGGLSGLKVPKCTNCGAARVFELQLSPHAITELEADELSVEGMDWGTIILAVCSADCQEPGKAGGELGYVEEWIGVQWEEVAGSRRQ